MKISHLLFLALVATALSTTACKDNKETTTTPEQTVSPEGAMTVDPAAATATPAATPAGGTEAHYKCTKAGCTGTGAQQGKCAICGSDLAHNQAFHAQAGAAGDHHQIQYRSILRLENLQLPALRHLLLLKMLKANITTRVLPDTRVQLLRAIALNAASH